MLQQSYSWVILQGNENIHDMHTNVSTELSTVTHNWKNLKFHRHNEKRSKRWTLRDKCYSAQSMINLLLHIEQGWKPRDWAEWGKVHHAESLTHSLTRQADWNEHSMSYDCVKKTLGSSNVKRQQNQLPQSQVVGKGVYKGKGNISQMKQLLLGF